MRIAVVGLGLIGGSFCRSIKKNTDHVCLGLDADRGVMDRAMEQGAIDGMIPPEQLMEVDLTIICLHPEKTVNFIHDNACNFKKGSIVMDSCGIKGEIVRQMADKLKERGIIFIPSHPMAGTENSGFDYSRENLFSGASLIITPGAEVTEDCIDVIRQLSKPLGFRQLVISTPEEHDRIIAFTSQLAHILSSCYIKSPTAKYQAGFSAGSFQDMTRVAKLNENMWTELFMMNREHLISEIESIMENLHSYERVLKEGDSDGLRQLLRDGRILKEESMRNHSHIAEDRLV